ncbi:MAG: CoA protein activase [Candidatus Geothermincolia bacterium]
MILGWPRMGSIEIGLATVMDELNVDYVLAPPSSDRTLQLGVKAGPEFACFPLKTTLGNLIEALELGADTLIMVAGRGPCRFGSYAEMHRRILGGMGYEFRMVTLEFLPGDLPLMVENLRYLKQGRSWTALLRAIKFGLTKQAAVDRLEKRLLNERYQEENRGGMTAAYHRGCGLLRLASDYRGLKKAEADANELMTAVPRREIRHPVKIGIVGEFFMLLDPFFNLGVEEQLGGMGAMVERSIYTTDWIRPWGNNPIGGHHDRDSERAAAPYLSHSVGGEGIHSIGHTIRYAQEGFDGVLHLLPFTCMPETIAKAILPAVSRDVGIPVLSLVIDEQTGRAGVATRLEAFVDLARSRRKSASGPRGALHPDYLRS